MRSWSKSGVSGWIERRLAGICLILLAGCSADSQQAVLEDYVVRIARVARGEASVPAPPALPPYPARRELAVALPRRTIDVFEFFDLHGCDMGPLVGYRNSPLGRLQSASQRLGYEVAWLAAAERCGADAAEWMIEVGAVKRERLPALFWNATFAAPEMRVALGGSAPPSNAGLADLLRSLNDSFTEALHGALAVEELEHRLGRLRQASWVGPAREDWSRWRRYLGAASSLLETAGPRICLNRRPTPRTERLQNVFAKFYVERIQPEMSVRLARHEAWVAELDRLAGRLAAVQPPAFRAWYGRVLSPQSELSEWRRTRRAIVAHAEAWQVLFDYCNIDWRQR